MKILDIWVISYNSKRAKMAKHAPCSRWKDEEAASELKMDWWRKERTRGPCPGTEGGPCTLGTLLCPLGTLLCPPQEGAHWTHASQWNFCRPLQVLRYFPFFTQAWRRAHASGNFLKKYLQSWKSFNCLLIVKILVLWLLKYIKGL